MATGRHQPLCLDPLESARCERQGEVDIVDHQILHHAHVERPKREGRESPRLEVGHLAGPLSRGPPGGVESLDVTDRHDAACPTGGQRDLAGLVERRGQRLLHEEIESSLHERQHHGRMQTGGSRHHGGVDEPDQVGWLGEGPTAVGGRHAVARLGHRIDHGHEVRIPTAGQQPRMDRAEMPAANHRHSQPLHAALLRSRDRP